MTTPRPLSGATLVAALPIIDAPGTIAGYVVTVEYGDQLVVGTVRRLDDADWTNGRYVYDRARSREFLLAQALRIMARRATERTAQLDGRVHYDADLRDADL
ncbi:hypothetical protein [Actinoplanes sp. NPDC026670]|uniref:hypothetical protein n=1 Tax=Actinoplanes sp. NPDC026670 TaxID=3154700 RepID=UPI0033E3CE9E